MRGHGKWRRRWLCVAVLAIGGLMVVAAASAGEFAIRCQRVFQNNWKPTIDYEYNRCEGFNSRMDDYNTQIFYFNLNNGVGFTTADGAGPAGGVDTVDIFYVGTHGGASATDATLALKPVNTRTFSSTWKFGDTANQIAIFSQYACKTLQIDDNSFARWVNPFKGGLYLATGSHDILWDATPPTRLARITRTT